MNRYVCIHGHFYQPPRENPWLEAIELQDSAYPYHDWNERINDECYAANAASRILDDEGRITRIVNNYSRISFNFGPTVLSWMEMNARETYERIREADRLSMARFSGHGSALAQAYNHMILPLANRRDKLTQVRWGIADFRRRFGREPEGMWLPETAVDLETLDVLAECGIQFTILAPRQAERTREIGTKQWQDVEGDHVNATRAYVQQLPSGRSINLFFYDGPVSQSIAFERLLASGQAFAERLVGALGEENGDSADVALVNIATDGESYGHHHRHGDMALAFALHELEQRDDVTLTNYGEFLERHPPKHEVQIKEKSSWSCVHGVGRWMTDCGCNSGGRAEWHQRWREPLRQALDWLRDVAGPLYEGAASEILNDPWAARDAYIDVINDRSEESLNRYFATWASHELLVQERSTALQLLELQRNLMLMYTSCGWFFDELTGLETVQVLQYAGRAVQICEKLFEGEGIEREFVSRLETAESNIPQHRNGREAYERMVKPAMVDLLKVGGHFAVSSAFEEEETRERVFCYRVHREDDQRQRAGRSTLVLGQAHITSTITQEQEHVTFAVLHMGDHNIIGGARRFRDLDAYQAMVEQTKESYQRGDLTETILRIEEHFGEQRYTIMSLFRDDQRRILKRILESMMEGVEQSYRRVYEDNLSLLRSLSALGAPLPRVLRTTAEFVINLELERSFSSGAIDAEAVRQVFEDSAAWDLELDTAGLSFALQQTMERLADRAAEQPGDVQRLEPLLVAADLARVLPFEVDLWKVQNTYYAMRERLVHESNAADGPVVQDDEWSARFGALGELLRVAPGEA